MHALSDLEVEIHQSDHQISINCQTLEQAHLANLIIESEGFHDKNVFITIKDRLFSQRIQMLEAVTIQKYRLDEIIKVAQEEKTAIEITRMSNDLTIFCNCTNIEVTENVVRTPSDMLDFNARWYWQGFEDKLEELKRLLRQDGKVDNFQFCNNRLDGRGINQFVKDYFVIPIFGGTDHARVSITRDWARLDPKPSNP